MLAKCQAAGDHSNWPSFQKFIAPPEVETFLYALAGADENRADSYSPACSQGNCCKGLLQLPAPPTPFDGRVVVCVSFIQRAEREGEMSMTSSAGCQSASAAAQSSRLHRSVFNPDRTREKCRQSHSSCDNTRNRIRQEFSMALEARR